MTEFHLKSHDICIFIDETGHEDFKDPNYPIFGLGGMACFGFDYKVICKDWYKIRRDSLKLTDSTPYKDDEPATSESMGSGLVFCFSNTMGKSYCKIWLLMWISSHQEGKA